MISSLHECKSLVQAGWLWCNVCGYLSWLSLVLSVLSNSQHLNSTYQWGSSELVDFHTRHQMYVIDNQLLQPCLVAYMLTYTIRSFTYIVRMINWNDHWFLDVLVSGLYHSNSNLWQDRIWAISLSVQDRFLNSIPYSAIHVFHLRLQCCMALVGNSTCRSSIYEDTGNN